VGYLAHVARHAPGGAVDGSDGVVLVAGGHEFPHPFTNCVVRVDATVPARLVLERAERFFAPLQRGYAIWIRGHADDDLEDAVRQRGLWMRPPLEGMPGIHLGQRIVERPPAPGVEIVPATTPAQQADYLVVMAGSYGLAGIPVDLAERIFVTGRSLVHPDMVAFVAYVDGEAVGCMSGFVTGDVAGAYAGATLPPARGRGVGRALMVVVTDALFDRGVEGIVGQSSAMGTPIWESQGYREFTRYRRYLAKPPDAGGVGDTARSGAKPEV
jgi:GNAT superfamily N-acetyltransferase